MFPPENAQVLNTLLEEDLSWNYYVNTPIRENISPEIKVETLLLSVPISTNMVRWYTLLPSSPMTREKNRLPNSAHSSNYTYISTGFS